MAAVAAVIVSTHHPFYYRASTAAGADRPPFADEWSPRSRCSAAAAEDDGCGWREREADYGDSLDLFHTMEAYFTWYPEAAQ
jgi:hypothetical protein